MSVTYDARKQQVEVPEYEVDRQIFRRFCSAFPAIHSTSSHYELLQW
jgi:hypothetical protein